MKPYVIFFDGNWFNGPQLHQDGKTIAQDTRESMRFDTEREAQAYIDINRDQLEKIGADPEALFDVPSGYTHH